MDKKVSDISKIFEECVLSYSKLKQVMQKDSYKDLMEAVSGDKLISKETAEAVAHAAKDWAVFHGRDSFYACFQPQTDLSAEKHDAFFSFDSDRAPIANYQLLSLFKVNLMLRVFLVEGPGELLRREDIRPGTRRLRSSLLKHLMGKRFVFLQYLCLITERHLI
jgi:hypothetical protein